MAIAEPFVGAPTVSTSEWSFPTNSATRVAQTVAGEYYVLIDVVANMVAGDQFRFRVYDKINGAGATQRVLFDTSPTGAQSQNLYYGPLLLKDGWDVTAQRVTGADRVIPFSIRAVTNDVNVTSMASGTIAAATFAANAITSTVIASAAITAAKFATDAIDANALKADAVTEIQSGLATSTALAAVQTDTTALTGRLTSGRATNLDNLDAAISTRAPSSTAVSNVDYTTLRAGKLDNLDAAVTTRAAAATALSTAQWTNVRAGLLDDLDATISSRAPASTAVSSADYTTLRAGKLDSLDAAVTTRASSSALATVQASATDVQGRLPAALDGSGNIKAGVQSLVAGAITSIADAVFAYVVEAAPAGATTFLQRLRVEWSVFAARATGLAISAAATEHFRDAADTKDRATFTLATDGTRTPGTVDGT